MYIVCVKETVQVGVCEVVGVGFGGLLGRYMCAMRLCVCVEGLWVCVGENYTCVWCVEGVAPWECCVCV